MNTILHMNKARKDLRARCDMRQGFLSALERRLFPRLPPMLTEAELRKWRESEDFKAGENLGRSCALATSDIDYEPAANEATDPMLKAAAVGLALFSVGALLLSIVQGGVA